MHDFYHFQLELPRGYFYQVAYQYLNNVVFIQAVQRACSDPRTRDTDFHATYMSMLNARACLRRAAFHTKRAYDIGKRP